MLNNLTPNQRSIILWSLVAIFVILGIVILSMSFGGREENLADVNAIYTNAAMTMAVQQMTLQANSTSTPNPALFTPTATFTPPPSPTLPSLPAQIFVTPTTNTALCENSIYVTDVTIPDGTTIAPSQTFTKTWRVSNTGTCAWTATYQVILIAGEGMSGKSTPIGQVVNPGATVDVTVTLVAPKNNGNYTGTWRLMNDKGQPFGTTLTVVIKVGPTTTGTPATATPVTQTATPITPSPTPVTPSPEPTATDPNAAP